MKLMKSKKPQLASPFFRTRRVLIVAVLGFVIIAGGYLAYWRMNQDTYCYRTHATTSKPPEQLKAAFDWFEQGNYDYDTGNCAKAVADYGIAIGMFPRFAQALNNRAYTYMRMQNYEMALPDLDAAIEVRPLYFNAIRNRADLLTFYLKNSTRSGVPDYDKLVELGQTKGTSVCGHRAIAMHHNIVFFAFWNFLTKPKGSGC